MEKSPKRKKNADSSGELGVTGVSRSGRVRKKSSKLMDFESPEDVNPTRYKRSKDTPVSGRGRKPHFPSERSSDMNIKTETDTDMEFDRSGSESDSELGMFPPPDLEDSSLDSDEDDDDIDDDAGSPDPRQSGSAQQAENGSRESGGTQAQSLYMLEKSSKKRLVIRDGKIVGRMKAERKDKGKARFTAYMLWAKEIRRELVNGNPDIDFATMSKRLGELWATVPNSEKYTWKRRAKRLAVLGHGVQHVAPGDVPAKYKPQANKSKFINMNKATTAAATKASKATRVLQLGTPSVVGNIPISPPDSKSVKAGGLVADPVVGPGMYKVVGTQPVDVAAHLKLLGDSLTIIGERLQEHEGQIAVSGSLSVLLDSLLCALGPLLCLTQQAPESDGCSPELLTKILDNIAYFMPGL